MRFGFRSIALGRQTIERQMLFHLFIFENVAFDSIAYII